MKVKTEGKYVSRFLVEEVPKSIGLRYVPENIKKYFDIKRKDGMWGSSGQNRKKKY